MAARSFRQIAPGLPVEIEPVGRQRLVGGAAAGVACLHRLLARLIVVLDLVEALADRLVDEMVEGNRRVGQVVEQRLQPVGEERQPVLHADDSGGPR